MNFVNFMNNFKNLLHCSDNYAIISASTFFSEVFGTWDLH